MKREEIIKAFEELENNYRLVALRDSCDYDNVLGAVYLNNKHSLKDFQNAIYKAKKKRAEEFYKFGVGTNKTDIINWFNQRVNIREEK